MEEWAYRAGEGILTHFVLQHLDLGRISSIQDIQDQIQGMVEKELIHEGRPME